MPAQPRRRAHIRAEDGRPRRVTWPRAEKGLRQLVAKELRARVDRGVAAQDIVVQLDVAVRAAAAAKRNLILCRAINVVEDHLWRTQFGARSNIIDAHRGREAANRGTCTLSKVRATICRFVENQMTTRMSMLRVQKNKILLTSNLNRH